MVYPESDCGLMWLLSFFSTVFSSNKSKVSSLRVRADSPGKSRIVPGLRFLPCRPDMQFPSKLALQKNQQRHVKTGILKNSNSEKPGN